MNLEKIPVERITEIFLEQYYVELLREKGYKIDTYFDTHDVYSLVQGYWSLENQYGVIDEKKIELNDTSFLLKGLAYFQKIKNLKVFKPHYLEITRLLEKDHCFPARPIPNYLIEKLFETLQLGDLNVFRVNYNTEDRRIRSYLQKTVRRSKNLFKAHYIFVEPDWTLRAKYLLSDDNSLIKTDNNSYDLNDIISSDLFSRLFDKLNKRRGIRKINNFRDALSLCMLNKAAKSNSHVIPFFLATSETIMEIASDEEFSDDFILEFDSFRLNLIKSQEFFLFDIIFTNDHGVSETLFLKLNELKEKRRLFYQQGNNEEFLKALQKDISDFVNQEFFDILKELGKTDLNFDESVSKLIDFQKTIRSEKVQEKIEQERTEIVNKLKRSIYDLEFFEKIWNEVDKIDHFEFNKILLNTTDDIDIFKDAGLTRFSIPQGRMQDRIRQIWDTILYEQAEENHVFVKAKTEIVSCLFDGLKELNYELLTIGCSLMYVFRSYDLIADLLMRLDFNYGPNYCLAGIHAAALCKSNHPNKKESVDKILTCFTSEKDLFENRCKRWILVAFIQFRLWESERNPHFKIDITPKEFENDLYKYSKDAIDLAQRALDWLKDNRNLVPKSVVTRNINYLYSLNIYVYYVSRSAPADQFLSGSFELIVEELQQARDTTWKYWQSTYDHTLSTYYFRRYCLNKEVSYLDKAKWYFGNFAQHSLFGTSHLQMLDMLIDKELNTIKRTS